MDKYKNNTVNCKVTHFLMYYDLEKKLCLSEGQAMHWFSFDEIIALTNKPDEIEILIKMVSTYLKSL